MKRLVGLFVAAMLAITAVNAWAAGDIKIGYVDFSRVQSESKAGLAGIDTLKAMAADKQKEITKREADLDAAMSEYQKQAPMLSDDVRKQKEDKIEKDYKDYERFKQDAQDELKKKQSEIAVGMLKDIMAIIESYGKQEGYTLILDRSVVLYAPEAVDITDKVIKAYDESRGSK